MKKKVILKNPVCFELWGKKLFFRVPIWGFFEEKKCLLNQMVSTCGGKKSGLGWGLPRKR